MIKIYGSSDDLIEIEGNIVEEFGVTDSDPRYIATSTGVLAKITYDGDWNIKIINHGSPRAGVMSCGTAAEEHTGNDYSDVLFAEKVDWVICGTDLAR